MYVYLLYLHLYDLVFKGVCTDLGTFWNLNVTISWPEKFWNQA